MTNFELFDYTQTWLLIKYSKFVNGSNNVTSYQSSSRMHGDNWKVRSYVEREYIIKFLNFQFIMSKM
jgi:hypothetical protein